MHHDFYRHAEYYDIAFSYRDVLKETDFLVEMFRRHGGRPLQSAIELCSGPGYHAIELARRKVRSAALDLAPDMIRLLRAKADVAGVKVDGFVDDMRSFEIDQRFDLAYNLLTSISYLTTNNDILAHMKNTAAHLTDGGLYVVENNHPKDFFVGDHFAESKWTMVQGDVAVETSWMFEAPKISWVDQTYVVKARYRVTDGDARHEFVDEAPLRMLLPLEMSALAAQAGLRLMASFGDWDVAQPLDDGPGSWRNIAVFRKGG
jgi:SAM-dependent methyltransferase